MTANEIRIREVTLQNIEKELSKTELFGERVFMSKAEERRAKAAIQERDRRNW